MMLKDLIALSILLGMFVFVVGTVWHWIWEEIEYRKYMRKSDE